MEDTHYYDTEVGWMGRRRGYLRSSADLPVLEVSSPPEFQGQPHTWTPEHLFVASVNSCFMATFIAIAELSKLEVVSFSSTAVGKLEKRERSGFWITEITLKPRLVIKHEREAERALRILEKAEKKCLITNSILSEVSLEPQLEFEEAFVTA
jgi:peroxiredoxin-like protein